MTESQAKDFVLFRLRGEICGHVTWNPVPPEGMTHEFHKLSLMDAVETASCFILRATNISHSRTDEKIIAGQDFAVILSMLPGFVMGFLEAERGKDVITVGTLQGRTVYWSKHSGSTLAMLTTGTHSVQIEMLKEPRAPQA